MYILISQSLTCACTSTYVTITIFKWKTAARRTAAWREVPLKNSTELLNKASHLTAFCAWDSSPHLPVNPWVQLMKVWHWLKCITVHWGDDTGVTVAESLWQWPNYCCWLPYCSSCKFHKEATAHCKNKLAVLTTEWLPWLQTSQRDSG